MVRTTLRRASLAAAVTLTAALGASTAAPSPAAAYQYTQYCNALVGAHAICPGISGRYLQNAAFYFGDGNVSVCQKGFYAGTQISRTCANRTSFGGGADYGYYYNNNLLVNLYVGNDSNYAHTIVGRGYYGTPNSVQPASTSQARSSNVAALSRGGVSQTTSADALTLNSSNDGDVCVTTKRFGLLTCNRTADTKDGATQGVVICSPQLKAGSIAVYGVAPDGTTSVDLSGPRGVLKTAKVVNNTYAFEVPAAAVRGATTTVLHAGANTTTSSASLPSDLSCS